MSPMTNRLQGSGSRTSARWVAVQVISPFVFAAYLAFVVWGQNHPDLASSDTMFKHLMIAITITLIYLAIQGFAVVLQPLGSDIRPLIDVLTSLAPLLVIALAAERFIFGALLLNHYQIGVLAMATIAAVIDLTCFTLFAMKVNRLAPDVVLTQ